LGAGINRMSVSNTGMNAGIGFAIPSNMAKNIMAQLVEKGKVVRGYLGVGIQDVQDKKLADSLKLPNTRGVLVTKVQAGQPAEKAGLKAEDFIVSVDGQEVENVNELRNRIASLSPGKEVALGVYRDGKKIELRIALTAMPDELVQSEGEPGAPSAPGETSIQDYGLTVQNLTPELAQQIGYKKGAKGVLVVNVAADSDASEKGVRKGMLITHVGRTRVASAEEFHKAMEGEANQGGVRLRLRTPDGGVWMVFLSPKPKK
jgi:serine protease Do